MTDGVNELSLLVRVSEEPATKGWSELVLIVDGAELFTAADEGIGGDPRGLTGNDSPLLTTEPRQVIVRVCACGERGCGSTAVRVHREGDRYVWDDWSSSLELSDRKPTLSFDAATYEETVRSLPSAHTAR